MSDDTTAGDTGTTTAAEEIGYADALAELDAILDELDDDGIDIDVLSARVERAAHLIAVCRGRIAVAQSQVTDIVSSLGSDPGASD